jgi:hypothetical protein
MKTFSTDGRIPAYVLTEGGESARHADPQQSPEELAWHADTAEAVDASWTSPRFVTMPGREPMDLEAISDLWLD